MGSGASANVETAIKAASQEELTAALQSLDAGSRGRLQRVLDCPIPSVTLVPGVTATCKAREWRCKYEFGGGKEGGLKNSKALEEAQVLLSEIIAKLKEVSGVRLVRRLVCGACADIKLVTAVAVNDPWDTWKKSTFTPESEFLEKLGKIEGISVIESQTYTFQELAKNQTNSDNMLTIVPSVDAYFLAREWRCKFTPSGEAASGAIVNSKSCEAALEVLSGMMEQLKSLPGLSSLSRVVCGQCNEIKVMIIMPVKEFGAWEGKAFQPELDFLKKLTSIEGLHTIETQTLTVMDF